MVSDKSKFEIIRVNSEYYGEFVTFVNLCLVHFTTSKAWRCNCDNTYNSNIFTVTDAALVIRLLEKIVDDYQKTSSMIQKLKRKESKPKYRQFDNKNIFLWMAPEGHKKIR